MASVGTSFRSIINALKQKLVADEILPDGVVYVTLRMNPPALDGMKSLAIVPLYQMFVKESTDGHGRCGTYKKARVNIYYRHESLIDQTYQDDEWLLQEDRGYFDVIDRIEDSVDLWHPQDTDNNFLLTQPARCLMNNEPRKNYQDHTRGDGMVELELEFQARRTVS